MSIPKRLDDCTYIGQASPDLAVRDQPWSLLKKVRDARYRAYIQGEDREVQELDALIKKLEFEVYKKTLIREVYPKIPGAARFYYLRREDSVGGRHREVTVCIFPNPKNKKRRQNSTNGTRNFYHIGLAIKSGEDSFDHKFGRALAYVRAIRAMKGREDEMKRFEAYRRLVDCDMDMSRASMSGREHFSKGFTLHEDDLTTFELNLVSA